MKTFLCFALVLASTIEAAQTNSNVISTAPALSPEQLNALLNREIKRSKSDYVVYRPKSVDASTFDSGNEHFLVFDGPDGSLMAVWTQSSYESAGDHRIVFARSDDEGKTWTPPKRLVGPVKKGDGNQASWGFPMISKSGRIYVVDPEKVVFRVTD